MSAGARGALAAIGRALVADRRLLLAIAATYHLFLLFAQFGFLEQLQRSLDGDGVRAAMAAMGIAGLLASLGMGRRLERFEATRAVSFGLALAAVVAAASPFARAPFALAATAAAIGLSVGILTVALAGNLARLSRSGRPALVVGAGTGLAYLLSNLPPLFAGSIELRAWEPALLAAVAAFLPPRGAGEPSPPLANRETLPLAAAAIAFLLLVGLDAAAFAVLHGAPALAAVSWDGGAWTLVQGIVHFAAAFAAGLWLERGRWKVALLATWGLFALAFPILAAGGPSARAGAWLYAIGIAIYSTALVAFPALAEPAAGRPGWRAGVLYGISGWVGSALGVGMAQDLGRVPTTAVLGAGALLVGTFALVRGRQSQGSWLAAAVVPALVGALGLGATGCAGRSPLDDRSAVARGRAVYVAEGCIHCHSQFVRPGTRDEALWGPARALDRAEQPPLVGMRRQGPDLANVGLRRSDFWQRVHLANPRALIPGSRMPSYADLFAGDGRRGSDLVAYLGSLGAGHADERARQVAALPPETATGAPSAARGARLFAALCAPCHGASGRGDGALAASIARPAMDLAKGFFIHLPPGLDAAGERRELERLVRFGAPPTSMPGHETLRPGEVADLVEFVLRLAGPRRPPGAERGS